MRKEELQTRFFRTKCEQLERVTQTIKFAHNEYNRGVRPKMFVSNDDGEPTRAVTIDVPTLTMLYRVRRALAQEVWESAPLGINKTEGD